MAGFMLRIKTQGLKGSLGKFKVRDNFWCFWAGLLRTLKNVPFCHGIDNDVNTARTLEN